ncbi:hypothetical protein RHMOL_Rhmol04G0281300 [Rhododendron molle]|uniref:Uncharacterized protein n=1 Tax=Rhododendron molle TaxID=49168 RepID=A0ACC0P6J4_RHOML|nr:hypothetical protein RHMOL_Rhmol04G0281300 [Rhododendron molle]
MNFYKIRRVQSEFTDAPVRHIVPQCRTVTSKHANSGFHPRHCQGLGFFRSQIFFGGFRSMWRRPRLGHGLTLRRLSTAVRRRPIEDEGDWCYSSEWWGTKSDGHTVFRATSDKGNGVVSVVAYPSSKPSKVHWQLTQQWLQQRYAEIHPDCESNVPFRILGYQWRTLRFNDDTRQSAVKIMAAYRESDPGSVCFMQQAHCLAVPYVKSMVSTGLATLASCNYDLTSAVLRKKVMNILCIGHGGGTLPLFLGSKIQGAVVHIVEIDPLVISASIQAMGFPPGSLITPSGKHNTEPDLMSVLWKGIHERLFLYESDAEEFIHKTPNLYDIVFVDAYDGEDIFPRKLWDPHSPFLKALEKRLHPDHGTVVVNLHADSDIPDSEASVSSVLHKVLPMGKYVSGVCRAYKDVLVENGSGFAFTVAVPWVCNTSLVVCRGSGIGCGILERDLVLNPLASKSQEVETMLDLPFSCLEYIKRGFTLVD